MKIRPVWPRRFIDNLIRILSIFAAGTGIFILGWILREVIGHGFVALTPTLLTQLPTPPGVSGGGLANAILGTLMLTILATVIGVPVGMAAGVFLAEFGQHSRVANAARFCANVLMGMPSILIGVFVFAFMVKPMGHFSGFAGAVALAIIMLPIVARTAEDMLMLVPNALRESALALGAPRWKVTNGVVFRAAKSGLLTGILLAIARVSGETAPLLFTALNSPYWPSSLKQPVANLPVTIFNYAMSPYPEWQQAAWGASFLIAMAVLGLTIAARVIVSERRG